MKKMMMMGMSLGVRMLNISAGGVQRMHRIAVSINVRNFNGPCNVCFSPNIVAIADNESSETDRRAQRTRASHKRESTLLHGPYRRSSSTMQKEDPVKYIIGYAKESARYYSIVCS